jgi:hypothetical protein
LNELAGAELGLCGQAIGRKEGSPLEQVSGSSICAT